MYRDIKLYVYCLCGRLKMLLIAGGNNLRTFYKLNNNVYLICSETNILSLEIIIRNI